MKNMYCWMLVCLCCGLSSGAWANVNVKWTVYNAGVSTVYWKAFRSSDGMDTGVGSALGSGNSITAGPYTEYGGGGEVSFTVRWSAEGWPNWTTGTPVDGGTEDIGCNCVVTNSVTVGAAAITYYWCTYTLCITNAEATPADYQLQANGEPIPWDLSYMVTNNVGAGRYTLSEEELSVAPSTVFCYYHMISMGTNNGTCPVLSAWRLRPGQPGLVQADSGTKHSDTVVSGSGGASVGSGPGVGATGGPGSGASTNSAGGPGATSGDVNRSADAILQGLAGVVGAQKETTAAVKKGAEDIVGAIENIGDSGTSNLMYLQYTSGTNLWNSNAQYQAMSGHIGTVHQDGNVAYSAAGSVMGTHTSAVDSKIAMVPSESVSSDGGIEFDMSIPLGTLVPIAALGHNIPDVQVKPYSGAWQLLFDLAKKMWTFVLCAGYALKILTEAIEFYKLMVNNPGSGIPNMMASFFGTGGNVAGIAFAPIFTTAVVVIWGIFLAYVWSGATGSIAWSALTTGMASGDPTGGLLTGMPRWLLLKAFPLSLAISLVLAYITYRLSLYKTAILVNTALKYVYSK